MDVNIQKPLTPKQKQVLDFVNKSILEHGYPPSLSEIARHLEKSISTAQHFIEELHARGYIQKEENIARGIISTDETKTQIFKLGYIAAGNPIDPIENPEPIDIPSSFLESTGNYYALEVKGDSMIDEGILDRDIIVIKHQATANNGDIIVAVTEKGATLKIFKNKNGEIFLEPRNKNLKNIYPKTLDIRGKFVGLVRKS
jgi:repressor LexA